MPSTTSLTKRTPRILFRGHKRTFSTTCRLRNHYQTLGIPQDASKAQVKLSKKHHPDLSKDPKSQEVFRKLSEAYQVLSNDRERRAYDRSLLHRAPLEQGRSPFNPQAPPSRSPKATHAWEYSYSFRTAKGTYSGTARSSPGGWKRPPPDYDASLGNKTPGAGSAYTGQPYHDVLTGSRKRAEEFHREVDRIRNVSTFYRATQIVGFLAVSISLFGGFGMGGGVI